MMHRFDSRHGHLLFDAMILQEGELYSRPLRSSITLLRWNTVWSNS